ncbi:MAG: hypothetical protein AB7V46_11900 [Thermomicrobiales bacterium]
MTSVKDLSSQETQQESDSDALDTELVAKFGSFFLTSAKPFEQPYLQILEAVTESLEQDPRVQSVQISEELDEWWCLPRRVFPSPADEDGIATDSDAVHTLQLGSYLLISVQRHAYSEGESSRYLIAWDGFLAVVAWRVPRDDLLATFEGDEAKEILGEALDRLNLQLYLQGCNPDCEHKFAHTTVRFAPQAKGVDGLSYSDSENPFEVEARAPEMEDEALVDWLFTDLLVPIRSFAILKNLGRRILESELDSRARLSELMQFSFRRVQVRTAPPMERIRLHWHERGSLREARLLIARVWLMLANIEAHRRNWAGQRFQFERASTERGLRMLFERDYADEVDRVDSLDLVPIRSAVEEVAERLDSRALLQVTAVAAVAGAIAGGLIGGLASGGF